MNIANIKNMLDYKLLEAMALVVREGGFERAARVINLTQSAVSQRVKLLEEQTGQVLLARTSPPLPTEAGRRLLKHYRQVKRLEEDFFESFTGEGEGYTSLPLGVNADSLATWFWPAVRLFIDTESVLLDLRVDDQEQTHKLLKGGEVLGCISVQPEAAQGCRVEYLGCMDYRLVATPNFAARWFPDGLTPESAAQAPIIIFNRKDDLQNKALGEALGETPSPLTAHYVPSSEKFVDVILSGSAYGMLPDLQCADHLASGRLVDLAPLCRIPVHLYWHCWNLTSGVLERFSQHLTIQARKILMK